MCYLCGAMAETDVMKTILERAEQAFLQYGLRAITMSELAARMGMSKKTLYRYFETKEELVYSAVRDFLEREHACLKAKSAEAPNAVMEMFLVVGHVISLFRRLSPNIILETRKYYASAWELIEGMHFEHIREMMRDNLQRGIEQGLYRPEINAEILSRFYVKMTDVLVDEQVFPSEQFERMDLFHQFIAYHMYGIVSAKGRKVLERQLKKIGCLPS